MNEKECNNCRLAPEGVCKFHRRIAEAREVLREVRDRKRGAA